MDNKFIERYAINRKNLIFYDFQHIVIRRALFS